MTLSIIIPAYNDLLNVLTVLNSLQHTAEAEHEYLIQDDASPQLDLSLLIPRSAASVVRNPHNLGFAGNCNAGATRSTGDILFFVNQDVYAKIGFSEGWDRHLIAAFDDPAVGIVGCKLVFPDGKIQHAGGLFDARCQPTHRYLGYSNHHHPRVDTPEAVSWVTGAALAIRRSLFFPLGGFDTGYVGGYFEDVDLCAKVAIQGHVIWYEPRVQLVHQAGTSGGNPRFMQNAHRFKQRWVDAGYVEPDVHVQFERFW